MTDQRNIRNSGIFIGGNNSNSPITMGGSGPVGGMDEAEVLRQLDGLFTTLLADVLRLSPEQAGTAAYQAAQLKAEAANWMRLTEAIGLILKPSGGSR